jgi:CelD/BcsL family acetyltransferase involved in cellulose biosynthesis
LSDFDALRPHWDELRRSDLHASLFLSSGWLRSFLAMSPTPWSILTLRDGGRLIAALPVSLRAAPHRRVPLARELTFASEPFADYQGLLCAPGREDAAIEALAAMVRAMPWDRARFPDVQDPRFAAFVDRLATGGATVERTVAAPCSIIDLPDDFETYLATLSKPTRRGTLRPLKVLAAELPGFRVSDATAESAEEHIRAMLDISALRWGSTPARRRKYERLFRAAFAEGCLRISIMWDGAHPFAGGAAFIDAERGTYGAYQVGHDPAYNRFSPGKAILATRIREAIEGGYRVFDFMRGGESYKSSYANREVSNVQYTLRRRSLRGALLRLADPGYAAARAAYARVRLRGAAAPEPGTDR